MDYVNFYSNDTAPRKTRKANAQNLEVIRENGGPIIRGDLVQVRDGDRIGWVYTGHLPF